MSANVEAYLKTIHQQRGLSRVLLEKVDVTRTASGTDDRTVGGARPTTEVA